MIVGKLGITNQRKFIKNYFKEGDQVVSIDDDVEGIFKLVGDNPYKLVETKAKPFFISAFKRLEIERLYMWGIYPVRNPFFMKPKVTTDLKFIIGVLRGFINRHSKDLEPSEGAETKEDYEQSILYFKKDGGVLRYNNVTTKTKFNAPGGLGTDRHERNKSAAEYLKKTYPDLITIFHRKNGMTEVRLARAKSNITMKNLSKNKNKTRKNR